MLNLFKGNSIFKYYIILFIILSSKLYSQDISNKYNLQLNYDPSNQWWSQYNNYGQKRSKIYFNYDGTFKYDNLNLNINIFALGDKIYLGESFIQSKLFNNTYLKAGKYYRDFSSYLNEFITSGSMLISNNAEPMPKIGITSSYELKRNSLL